MDSERYRALHKEMQAKCRGYRDSEGKELVYGADYAVKIWPNKAILLRLLYDRGVRGLVFCRMVRGFRHGYALACFYGEDKILLGGRYIRRMDTLKNGEEK